MKIPLFRRLWRNQPQAPTAFTTDAVQTEQVIRPLDAGIATNDPLLVYLAGLKSTQGVELENLKLTSPALDALRAQGIRMIAPLFAGGALTSIIALDDRRSDQEYTSDDHQLLGTVMQRTQPALRVAQLAQTQRVEAEKRGRIEEELRVARVIQETLLPKEMPKHDGWQIAAFWQPAREVSGDFYDFIPLSDGRLAIIEADVTGKGVPAALVVATTRALLRSVAEQSSDPGAVLKRVNERLCPDIPPNMFVTCWLGVLDTASGQLLYANAGHNPPCLHSAAGTSELRATGMPLGLMDDMEYVVKTAELAPGDRVVIYSDGLVEAHAADGSMFGFPRLRELIGASSADADVIAILREQLEAHVGANWEPEDDVTLLTLERRATQANTEGWQTLTRFSLASAAGNETEVMRRVAASVADQIPPARLEKLKTAVAEATMNAMEHGNGYASDKPVDVEARINDQQLVVRIVDLGAGDIPDSTEPDLDLKLAGLQSPRGWGLFLIRSMVDELHERRENGRHVVELVMNR